MIQSSEKETFQVINHNVDFCVVGGGMAGMLAAISAARSGAKVLLINDRPVLGGNASSEIRMWIRGAHGDNMQETGILEEIALENIYRNPSLNFSIWDSVLFGAIFEEPNIELLLNCSCNDLEMNGDRISSVKAWQTTTQQWHVVKAKYFADCSGDSVLAPLSGAERRWGREASDEFAEDIQPSEADKKTMGLTCLMQARETSSPQKYIPPKWAYKFTKDDFPHRLQLEDPKAWQRGNFWWMELGGNRDSIRDTEVLRDELIKISFGTWDFIKNSGHFEAENWELEWVGFLPGKRESRRYVGDHILNQNDVEKEGRFDDIVAYGGWTMDDHHPDGFRYKGQPTIFHPAPSPYGIPYRSLYSKNISNLFFAGRNISATHAALSSTRVMATCAIMGQAIGTAAAIATRDELTPRGVYEKRLEELKQTLMEDDCYLPFNSREMPELTKNARLSASAGDAKPLVNGNDRPIGDEYNGWVAPLGSWVEFDFGSEVPVSQARMVFDNDLNRETWREVDTILKRFPMKCNIPIDQKAVNVPETLIKSFRLEVSNGDDNWKTIYREDNNYQRLVKVNLDGVTASKIRLVSEETWGCEEIRIFAFDVS